MKNSNSVAKSGTEWILLNADSQAMVCWKTPQLIFKDNVAPRLCSNMCTAFEHTKIDVEEVDPTAIVTLHCMPNGLREIDVDVEVPQVQVAEDPMDEFNQKLAAML